MATKAELEIQVTELQARVKDLELGMVGNDLLTEVLKSRVTSKENSEEIEALKFEYSKLIERSLTSLDEKDALLKNQADFIDALQEAAVQTKIVHAPTQTPGDLVILSGKQCVVIYKDTVMEVVDAWRKKNVYDDDIAVVVRKQ